MEKRKIGNSGIEVTVVGLGCNNFGWTIDRATSQPVVDKALDLGINLYDTADFYGTPPGEAETVLGQCLGARRKDVVLVTKFGVDMASDGSKTNTSRGYVLSAAEASLKRLGTDWIDVYMLHWPDHNTPMEETLRALEELVQSGKVRSIAVSNLDPWRIADAAWISKVNGIAGYSAVEAQYSLLSREIERDVIPMAQHFGMSLLPYFPLASGMLTGKYKRGGRAAQGRLADNFLGLGNVFMTERNFAVIETLEAFCAARGRTLLELAISWLASKPFVPSVICGATKPGQVEQNVAGAGWKLTAEELAEVDQLTA